MLEDYYKPFEDFDNVGVKKTFTRVFKESVKKEQLLWHKDRKDRKVKVVYGTGWKLQYDNQLPTELQVGQNYYINKNEFHRLHKGNSELKLEIKEYEIGRAQRLNSQSHHDLVCRLLLEKKKKKFNLLDQMYLDTQFII